MPRRGAPAVFVPDEESALWIEAFAAAAAPGLAAGLWPGWDPVAEPAGLVLPGAAGLCLLRAGDLGGREIAARGGGALPGLRHLTWADARQAGLPVLPGTPPRLRGLAGPGGATVTARRDRRRIVFVDLPGPCPGSPALAGALHGALFALWWAARAPQEPAAAAGGAAPECPEQAALAGVEGRQILELLQAQAGPDGLLRLATALALVRRERRAEAAEADVALERWREMVEGLPAYVAARAAEAAGGPAALGALAPALLGLAEEPAGLRARPVGWGLAAVLDRLDAVPPPGGPQRPWAGRPDLGGGWKAALAAGRVADLDAALEARLRFDGGARDDALLRSAQADHGYAAGLERARARAETAARARQALLERILRGSGTLLAVDVGALPGARVEAEAPPEAIHAGMAIYARGAAFRFPGGTLVHFRDVVLAEDRRSGLLQARVAARLAFSADGGPLSPEGEAAFEAGLDLELPGLRVHARAGSIRPIDGGYLIRVLR